MGRKNECSKGHQLYLISVNSLGWRWAAWDGWGCDGDECGYKWSPDKKQDQDVVWRCQHDRRKMSDCPFSGTTLINKIPWAGEAGADQEEVEDQAGREG